MDIRQAYNQWALQYDSNENKTRDLEAAALRKTLESISFSTCLEVGCGTGKNTEWLLPKAEKVTAVDLSEEMLAKAKEKIASPKVQFIKADITVDWTFAEGSYDLVTFSLVLEHINNLDFIFSQVSKHLTAKGFVYIGELHPFKQYMGSKARFDTESGEQVVECYTHNLSDFTIAAERQGLMLMNIGEYFDNDDKSQIPRILTLMLKKTV